MKNWSLKRTVYVWLRRLNALGLSLILALQLAACGQEKPPSNPSEGEWGYVPEFIDFDEEDAAYNDMVFSGDSLYYLSRSMDEEAGMSDWILCKYSLTDKQLTRLPLPFETKEDSGMVRKFIVAENGSIYFLTCKQLSSENLGEAEQTESDLGGIYYYDGIGLEGIFYAGDEENQWQLYKFDQNGNKLFSKDVSSLMDTGYACYMTADARGYLYIGSGSSVWRCDADGNEKGRISQEQISEEVSTGGLAGLGCSRDGKVYAAFNNYQSTGAFMVIDAMNYKLAELDFDGQKAEMVCEDFPYQAGSLLPGNEGDFLVYDGTAVYEYDLDTQAGQSMFGWLDCDINGGHAKLMGELKDGRMVVVYGDGVWGDEVGIALLTKTWLDPEAAKKTLVLATMSANSSLQAAVVDFNRHNEKYRIEIKEFYDYASGQDYSDGLMNLNNAIASNNCPDIIDLTGLEVEKLAAKGVFEDLGPYLEKSSLLGREDLLESILNAYTLEGVLMAIPRRFSVRTAVGSAKELAGIEKWTIGDVIAFCEAHPGAELFNNDTKSSVMTYLMNCSQDSFIDWSTGECCFDTDLFKRLLEFVNSVPDVVQQSSGMQSGFFIIDMGSGPSIQERVQTGEVLLVRGSLSDVNYGQLYREMFGSDVVFIGYPTADGESGHYVPVSSDAYAISSKSENKEGAWEFIEKFLMEDDGRHLMGFPALKSKLEMEIKKALNSGYVLDDNGDPILDEDGEPIVNKEGRAHFYDGWEYTYRPSTQEEINLVLKVLDEVRLEPERGAEIMNIINEEAEAFYQGQKTVDQVAEVIQRRVSLYVSENR